MAGFTLRMRGVVGTILLIVGVGLAFVAVGVWLYRNPTKLTPSWGLLNPENPKVQELARFYAIFFMFAGLMACSSIIVQRTIPSLTVILSFAIAAGGTWLIRRRLRDQLAEPAGASDPGAAPVAGSERLFNRHWKRNLAILTVATASLTLTLNIWFGESDLCKLAFANVQASALVRERLGAPVQRSLFTSGTIEIAGSSRHADIEFTVSGPKGKADVSAVARKSADVWKFDVLDAKFSDGTERVSLLAPQPNEP